MKDHDHVLLLQSYNRQCPDCRKAVAAISERQALDLLSGAVSRRRNGGSRLVLQNAISIYQSAAKRANAKGMR